MGEKLSEGPFSQKKKKTRTNLAFLESNLMLYIFNLETLHNLEISKKRGLSVNPDILHCKVPSSDVM